MGRFAVETLGDKVEGLLKSLKWQYKTAGSDQLLMDCPFCKKEDKLYMHQVDGLWDCKSCGERGNLFQLRQRLGLNTEAMVSMKQASSGEKSPLPNFDGMHYKLMNADDPIGCEVLDYLMFTRKYSLQVIADMKLGAFEQNGKPWLMMPYFDESGKPLYYKARNLPPDKKQFNSPAGYEAPLYNGVALRPGIEELVIVEGEGDLLAMLSAGYSGAVVGVPGANTQKTLWIDRIDEIAPKMVYLLYDRDKTGQDAAREMATKIGMDRTFNVVLPEFTTSEGKPGKDVNEYLAAGHTLEDLRELMSNSRLFDIAGVCDVGAALSELAADFDERGVEPKYLTPWPSLTKKVGGFEDGDVVGIMALGKCGKTTFAMNMLQYYASVAGHTCLDFCLEMPVKRSVRKWVSHVTGTDDTPGRSQMSRETIEQAKRIAAEMPGDMLFGYTQDKSPKAVFDTIRQAVRRYGVKIVCFDHLHLLCRSVEHQAQEVAKLAVEFKNLAMELGIVIFLIIQPNRVADNQIVSSRNALGSSFIEKMVDYMICLHRNRVAQIKESEFRGFLETDDNLEPLLLVRVDLARYASGGCCTLFIDGATSTVRELNETEASTPPTASGGIPFETEAVAAL